MERPLAGRGPYANRRATTSSLVDDATAAARRVYVEIHTRTHVHAHRMHIESIGLVTRFLIGASK